MPAPSDFPLRRCNLYLYASDVEYLERKYGHGWSEFVRKWVQAAIREAKAETKTIKLEDLTR